MTRKSRSIALAGLVLAVGLSACATQQTSNAAVDASRQRLARDEQNPDIRTQGQTALTEARQSLAAADAAAKDNNGAALNHELFMTDRALSTAEAEAQTAEARSHMATLSQQRDQVALQARNAQLAEAQRELSAYRARPTEQGSTLLTLNDLPFETGTAVLRPGAAMRLQPLVSYLNQHRDGQVIVQGNTDSTGKPEENQALSQERADAVRDYLVSSGVSPDRITAKGLGAAFPVASNATPSGRQQNRRVEVVIEPPSATAALPNTAPPPTPPQ